MAKTRKTPTRRMREIEQRIAGMKSIDPNLDLDNSITIVTVSAALAEANAALETYNMALATADEKLNIFTAKEKAARALDRKVLPAVGLKFGTDSDEYEMVGGVRDSERARPIRKPKTPTP